MGRSRGGLTTKVHAAVDRRGHVLKLLLTAGQCGDAPQAETLLRSFEPKTVTHVIADAAYDSDAIRKRIKQLSARTCIRPNPNRNRNRKTKKKYYRKRYRNRNVIERFFCQLKRFRRIATRYEKKAANFSGFLWLATILIQQF